MNLGEQYADRLCTTHGLRVGRFSKEELRSGKTPDFRVYRADELVFYCEAKHIQKDGWLNRQMEESQPGELVGGLRKDPIFNRLAEHIHKSSQQFAAVNPSRKFANVLVLVNSDQICGFPDLLAVLTGNFYVEGGGAEPIYRNISEGRIRDEKKTIDLYVWFNEWKGENQEGSWFFNIGGPHYEVLCELMGSNPAEHQGV